jgi:hypothetical protein
MPFCCCPLLLQAGRVCLSELRCVKPEHPEEGKKSNGKTTRFRLLLTLITTPGLAAAPAALSGPLQGAAAAPLDVTVVAPLVSEPFTLVTKRSKAAVKSEVPLPDEAASRLQGIGKEAAASLKAVKGVETVRVYKILFLQRLLRLRNITSQHMLH